MLHYVNLVLIQQSLHQTWRKDTECETLVKFFILDNVKTSVSTFRLTTLTLLTEFSVSISN